ncbi:uncharacterized protein LOC132195126 [Neocloeon triangulifer]|uniref:uncharacterized protein LOC132195126 n=1 Tax=Neocloeon triangulifer TaxID=2078957 RepID=UPI00286F83F6|nr:uncharacterized protein LOC132195126 [Neocloeon triangulifer]XP_059472885.1 uncharacterized protein LOC132195126 [Neocloeon triangulifer]XP_059472887.1 uncharacterized protein LOC132195126 [Neocloeon triangulifer]XP_059472888.1 uncharacterized protein LOC132195126 [Neocloeon triangulifer]XP_059472889.1 uncharacterized protein LOC132195126 [Neocloeon triangulifer]XP_059472890.1 uncharacterized protein LOC132195126 [Neocloeon triangulifer]
MASILALLKEINFTSRLLLANQISFLAARRMSSLKNKAVEPIKNNEDESDTESFVNRLVSNKADLWKNKQKLKRTSAFNLKLITTIMSNVLASEEEDLTKKQKIYPISFLKLAIDGEKFDEDEMLKILESPEILSKVDSSLLDTLATTFARIDFSDGVLQLHATSQRLPIPPNHNFIGDLFKVYKTSNQSAKALKVVDKFYTKYPNSRREARSYLATIIRDVVSNHCSEALLVQCKQLVLRINYSFGDNRPMIFLWHACFISEWFSDQQVAKELLHIISKNKKLTETFSKKLATATYSALGRGKPELVQGLIEDLISTGLHSHLTVPIRLLFDYKCQLGDLRGCAAIMKSTADLKVVLTSKQHQDFIDMMTFKKNVRWKAMPKKEDKISNPTSYEFEF